MDFGIRYDTKRPFLFSLWGTAALLLSPQIHLTKNNREVVMLAAGAYTENFRSALNGFNRTDVVQFIQRQTVEHEKSMRLLREENARLKQAASQPKADTTALQNERDELAQQLALCKEELANLTNQNRELADKVTSLDHQNAELTEQVNSLNGQNAVLQEKIDTYHRNDSSQNAHLDPNAALQLQLQTLTQENTDLRSRLETTSREAADARLQTESLTLRNTELQERVDALTGHNQELTARLESVRAQMADLRSQMEALTAEKSELTESLCTTRDALLRAEAACEAAKAANAETPAMLDRPISAPAGLASPPSSFDELELAAYRRAEQTERMARERAVASSNRIRNIFRQADEKMIMTAADMNQLLDAFRGNYEQMQVLMENARNILAESAESLKVSADLSSMV